MFRIQFVKVVNGRDHLLMRSLMLIKVSLDTYYHCLEGGRDVI